MPSTTTTILFGLLAANLAVATQTAKSRRDSATSDGPDNSMFTCGCDYLKDATIEDCQAAIDSIDVNSNDATDPTKALTTVHTGALSSDSVMFEHGSCRISGANIQTIQGPKDLGGKTVGTTATGQTVHDVIQAMVDACKDTDSGKVNACASVGAGNLDVGWPH